MTLKRYTFDPDCSHEIPCECSMEECKQGEYVLYEDYEAQTARADALEDANKRFKKCFVRISEAFGITSPLILISMAENDEENYAEILARYVEKQMKAPEDKP